MVVQKTITINGKELRKTYSDSGFTILQDQTQIEYLEAVDVLSSAYTYTETTNPITEQPLTAEEQLEESNQALKILGIND